jgi:ABC-type transport system involved in multi-copper enzyme maturation permease subunit
LLLFLFVFSYYFRISWRSFVFGIASGLAFYLAVQLAVSALAAHTYIAAANTIDTGAYHCSVLIWLSYLLQPHRSPVRVKSLPNHQLESWNLELERLLQR